MKHKNKKQQEVIELNPGNEALTQLREHWQKILVMVMHKYKLKEIDIGIDDILALSQSVPPDDICHLITIGKKNQDPKFGGFKLILCYGLQEAMEVVAQHQVTE